MEISTLAAFLASAKSNVDLAVLNNLCETHVVLGNESADLDSVVSAIVLAYYTAHSLAKEEKENKVDGHPRLVLPVINCPRDDLPLRTDIVLALSQVGIRLDQLICRDEIDLLALHTKGNLRVTLVDHNVLCAADAFLERSVQRVVDHHKRERPVDRRDIIEPVGSCATLIAEISLGLFDNDLVVCRLLYGTILLDTVNLSQSARKATEKDKRLISELEECIFRTSGNKSGERDNIFGALMKAKTDISRLTAEQLLRKDSKVLRTPEITIAVPSVPLLSQKFLELPDAFEALKCCLRANRCTAIVILGVHLDENNEIRRDITVFSDSIHKAKQVCTPLENCETIGLQLIRHSSESQAVVWVYNMKNVQLSRKFILPFLATHFEVKAQNQLDVDGLSGVDILIPNGEMSPNKLTFGNGIPTVPSISYTAVQNLGVGDPISQGGSSQSSAYNSCPYTPQNSCSTSCAEPSDGYALEHYFLPSFNSRDMIEKIELKRGKLRGYDRAEDELKAGFCSSYPFTPKNSYVDNSLESVYEQQTIGKFSDRQYGTGGASGGILHAIDSEVLLRKLMEKRRGDSSTNTFSYSPSSSSKSQSMTKLNLEDLTSAGDMMNAQLSGTGSGNPLGSPIQSQTPPHATYSSKTVEILPTTCSEPPSD